MLSYAHVTLPGSRSVNEDCVGTAEAHGKQCFIVCDGLGGHGKGEYASQFVVKVFLDLLKTAEEPAAYLHDAFLQAQEQLVQLQQTMRAEGQMKTTAVVLVMDAQYAHIGHIGDSRLYAFSGGQVKWRTRDHSVPEALVRMGEITDEEIRFHPDRNRLIRVMGDEWSRPMYELAKPIESSECQAFLLCTDGFWELITETEMCALLETADSVEQWLTDMLAVIRRNAENCNADNCSAIAVWNHA